MSCQFAHIECYARVAGKGKAGGHNIASILAEAGREPGACPHVENPQAPILRYGCDLPEVGAKSVEWAEQAKDTRGRKLRKDGLCLLVGVSSFPGGRPAAEWEAYRDDLIEKLQKQYVNRLLCVIEHTDENHPHVHYYCVALPGERFEVLHPGRQAAADAKAAGKKKGEQNKVYKEAMRAWQDDFWQEVGVRHGLTRIGPGKRRLTRAEWKAEQNTSKLISCMLDEIQNKTERIEFIEENIEMERKLVLEIAEKERAKTERERIQLYEIIKKIKEKQQDIELKKYADNIVRQYEDELARERRRKWLEMRDYLINQPKSQSFEQGKRRKELFKRYDFLGQPNLVRVLAVRSDRQSREQLSKIEYAQREIKNEIGAIGNIDELRDRLAECKPWQLFNKKKISRKIEKIEDLKKKLANLGQQEKKIISSYPVKLIEKYRRNKEEEREKAVLTLLQQELQEAVPDNRAFGNHRPAKDNSQGHRPRA